MNIKTSFILTLSLVLAVSTIAESKDKKKHAPRGMVESMQSVPCGARNGASRAWVACSDRWASST